MKHQARPIVTGYQNIKGIDHPVAVWTPDCQDCHRPVRRMYGMHIKGSAPVFYHSAGKAAPGDRRLGPRSPEHAAAIAAGMKAANERRAAR